MKILGPNRSFGLMLGGACAVAAVLAYRAGRRSDVAWALAASVLVLVALGSPDVLAPVRRGWLKIGYWLGVVINPIVLGAVYAVVVVPFGALMRLCRRDGVALNCVANGKILRDGKFDDIWIQPAAGDAGGAPGAALAAYYAIGGGGRVPAVPDSMQGAYLGPSFDDRYIAQRLTAEGAHFDIIQEDAALFEQTAQALAEGSAVGWFQGRMEFGPRALGNRSILADPRSADMQRTLNLKVKYRESFRPFAPAVLAEDVAAWFELDRPSPYMLLVADVVRDHRVPHNAGDGPPSGLDKLKAQRSDIPAVTHVDYSARVQTVHRETNPRFYALIRAFKGKTGCPVLVNTSFNVRGEPIAHTPEDAFRCLMGTEIEMLVVGNCVLHKSRQNPALIRDYRNVFDPD